VHGAEAPAALPDAGAPRALPPQNLRLERAESPDRTDEPPAPPTAK
jgi:hypothetical protein